MAKYGLGKLYGCGWLYGLAQHLLGVGNIPSAEALGTPWVFRIPKILDLRINIRKSAHDMNIRRLSAAHQIRRLQVTPNG